MLAGLPASLREESRKLFEEVLDSVDSSNFPIIEVHNFIFTCCLIFCYFANSLIIDLFSIWQKLLKNNRPWNLAKLTLVTQY